MPLLLTGQAFRRDLEANGCLAVQAPLEGGAETRLLRRLRGAGYSTRMTSARGLGDPEVFLTQHHADVLISGFLHHPQAEPEQPDNHWLRDRGEMPDR